MNIIVNAETQMLKIIDWGLGTFYIPGVDMSYHVGTMYLIEIITRSYKAPEILLH